jgi:hypothetical protein
MRSNQGRNIHTHMFMIPIEFLWELPYLSLKCNFVQESQ